MSKLRINNQFIAIVTFLVILLTTILSSFDMANLNVKADASGTTYFAYNYLAKTSYIYTLSEIPTYNYFSSRTIMTADDADPRPNASYDKSVVEITIHELGSEHSYPSTGFVIGEHTIMTAAHCVEAAMGSGMECTIRIPDGNPYTDTGSTVLRADEVHVPQAYINWTNGTVGGEAHEYDYAIIVVSESLTETYGCVPYSLGMATPEIVESAPVNCKGYYGNTLKLSADANVIGYSTQYNEEGNYTSNNLAFDFYSTYKTSGSPIYVKTKYEVGNSEPVYYNTVISIVSTSNLNVYSPCTYGYLIDSKVLQFAYDNNYL